MGKRKTCIQNHNEQKLPANERERERDTKSPLNIRRMEQSKHHRDQEWARRGNRQQKWKKKKTEICVWPFPLYLQRMQFQTIHQFQRLMYNGVRICVWSGKMWHGRHGQKSTHIANIPTDKSYECSRERKKKRSGTTKSGRKIKITTPRNICNGT